VKKTPLYSGSDISGVVQDALMEPVRTMQSATHFKKVKNPDDANDFILLPCSPADPQGKQMTLLEIPDADQAKVRAEKLNLQHFLRVLAASKPSVGKKNIKKHIDWKNEFGQKG